MTKTEETLFHRALEKPAHERAAFLEQACGGDAALRRRLEVLLSAHDNPGSFLAKPAAGLGATPDAPPPQGTRDGDTARMGAVDPVPPRHAEAPGVRIGPYKLLQAIGEGGMGTVYLAEQTAPVRRTVALKVIKAGMDSREVVARFDAERQALALMDHPNIARVFDAGTTADVRPYFVMELVKGVPITRYCDEHRLTPRERLELFIPVCQAVQHAHQKGVIHRDLKPSNVLVGLHDGRPVPKVIDFGVAKATGPKLTDATLFTGFGAVVGTPEYMSPEQAQLDNLDIDTRSDVYSLGVLLYELLTGTTPLDRKRLKQAAILEVLRVIREEEPPKPSTRLDTTEELPGIAARRGVEPRKLSGLVRGELDWVVMKALEKDRSRRYETANGLAADLRRYLGDEPVSACPPGAWYRLRIFARRNRVGVTAGVTVALTLVLATGVSTWLAVRATQAERRALADRGRAEASFRMARDAVDRSFTQVSQNPLLKARGLETFRRDQLRNAREFHERLIRERLDAPGVRHDLALSHLRLAEIDRELGRYPAAGESAARAVALLGALAAAHPDEPDYRRDLAAAHLAQGLVGSATGRYDKAEAAFGRAVTLLEALLAAHPASARDRNALAGALKTSGFTLLRDNRPNAAAPRLGRALDVLNGGADGDDATALERRSLLAATQFNLGQVALIRGRYDEAAEALGQAIRLYEGLVRDRPDAGPEDWQGLARSRATLGRVYCQTRKVERSEPVLEQALEVFERLAREHPDVQEFAYDVGRCLTELADAAIRGGSPERARVRFDKAARVLDDLVARGYGAAQYPLLKTRIGRALMLNMEGDHAHATEEVEALSRRETLNPVAVYDIACVYSQSAAVAGRDARLSPADRARLKARYAARAVEFLRDAVARGFDHPEVFRTDADLDPIRERDDFRALLSGLAAKPTTPGGGPTGR